METRTARRVTCPRCSAPVTGDFKFCPACAYRLHSGVSVEPEAPPRPPGARLGQGLLVLSLLGVLGGLVAFGLTLFGRSAPEEVRAVTDRLHRPLTVADLAEELVALESGTAFFHGQLTTVEVPEIRFLRFEVTAGQYAEFLRDVEAHPERVATLLREIWTKPEAEAGERRHAYAQGYVNVWWERAGPHLARAAGHPVERPTWLTPPLSDRAGLLLLVPPSWTRLTPFDEITWSLPADPRHRIPENVPVAEVSWYDAVGFAEWASRVLGIPFALPDEAEWLRAGQARHPEDAWPWGNDPLVYACNNLNYWVSDAHAADLPGAGRPLPVDFVFSDKSGATAEGIYVMAGNVAEWAWPSPSDAALAPCLGGSFRRGLADCTVTSRSTQYFDKRARADDLGFRLLVRAR